MRGTSRELRNSTGPLQLTSPSGRDALSDSPPNESEHGHPGIVLATLATANVMALLDLFVVNDDGRDGDLRVGQTQ